MKTITPYSIDRSTFNFTIEFCKKILSTLDIVESTRKEYSYRIKKFVDFIQNNGLYLNSFLDFKKYLDSDSKLAVSTKNKYLIVARIILKEMNRIGMLNRDITQNIKSFTTHKKHKKLGLNEDEVKSIVTYLNEHPEERRLRVIIALLLYQGLRQIELRRLKIEDIDLINKTAFIQGKGVKEKEIIHLHDVTIDTINKYLICYNLKDGYLLRSLGNRKSKEIISAMLINREVNFLFIKLDIKKNIHGFRHFYITILLKDFEPNIVRKFSRHKSLDMLIVYDDENITSEMSHRILKSFSNFCIQS